MYALPCCPLHSHISLHCPAWRTQPTIASLHLSHLPSHNPPTSVHNATNPPIPAIDPLTVFCHAHFLNSPLTASSPAFALARSSLAISVIALFVGSITPIVQTIHKSVRPPARAYPTLGPIPPPAFADAGAELRSGEAVYAATPLPMEEMRARETATGAPLVITPFARRVEVTGGSG